MLARRGTNNRRPPGSSRPNEDAFNSAFGQQRGRGGNANRGGFGGGADFSSVPTGPRGDFGTGVGSGGYGTAAGNFHGSGLRGHGSGGAGGGSSAPYNMPTGPQSDNPNKPLDDAKSRNGLHFQKECYEPPPYKYQDQLEVQAKGMGMNDNEPNCLRCGETKADLHIIDGRCSRPCCRCPKTPHAEAVRHTIR